LGGKNDCTITFDSGTRARFSAEASARAEAPVGSYCLSSIEAVARVRLTSASTCASVGTGIRSRVDRAPSALSGEPSLSVGQCLTMSAAVRSATGPRHTVVRSSVSSCRTIGTPSLVIWMSNSSTKPDLAAALKAGSVASG